ncbi:MAG: hypothetical protein ACO1TE_02275 [Prosthecobacter sp.]
MSTSVWIGIFVVALGLIAWLGYLLWDWLWWRDMHREVGLARVTFEEMDEIAKSSQDPLAALTQELQSTDMVRRCYAAKHIAAMGTREAGVVLRQALEDPSELVRQEARKSALHGPPAPQEFNDIIFDSVALGLREADLGWASPEGDYQGPGCEDVIHLLPRLNRERAIVELTKPHTLRINHPDLRELIHTLTLARATLDDAVFDWLAVLRPYVAEGRKDVTGRSAQVYAKLLRAAAFKRHPNTAAWIEDLFQRRAQSPPQVVESSALEGAAEAKAILAGLSITLTRDVDRRVESEGLDSLSPPEQHFALVSDLQHLIEQHGIGHYVLSSPSPVMDRMLQALAAIGDRYYTRALQHGLELRDRSQPKQGAPPLDETAQKALSDEIDEVAWPEDMHYQPPMMLAHLYAAANAEAFRDKV